MATDAGVKGVGVPTLLSASAQVFQVGAGATAAASILLTDDAVTPRFRANDPTGDIRIRIPGSLNMVWNTALTTPTLTIGGPAGAGAVSATVSYPPADAGKTLLINVTTDFAAGKTLTVTGLQFQTFSAPSLPAALQLEVNNALTNAGVDGQTKAIQGTPTIASAAQVFTKGDLATNATAITITDAGGVSSITTTQDIRIKIPAGLNLIWDPTIATIGSSNAKVSTTLLPYEDAGKTAVLNVVTSDFTPAEAVTITGLRFASFGLSSAGQLTLEVDGDPAAEATDAGVKGVGAPTIASASNQAFNVGDAATPIAVITVTEDAARPRLRNTTNLRVRIPSGFNMSWDVADLTATVSVVGGTGTASNTVSYEGGGAVLVVDILSDFTGGEVVQISNLSFTNFQGESPLDRLELDVSAAGTTCNEDLSTILIGGLPTISSAANQVFTVNDPATAIATITLTDAPGVATFRASREIRVRIPAGLPMEWNQLDATAVVTPGPGSGTAAAGVTFLDAGKTLQINITADFSPGQTLTVSGLSFANFALPGGSGFTLGLDVDLDVAVEAQDDKTLAVGAPILSSASSQLFVVGDPPTAASALTVTDGLVARITAAGDVRIRIPASLSMVWDTSVTTPTIGGSAGGKASATVTYEDAGKTLVVDVVTDLAPLETLVVSGVSFMTFSAASTPANLELEVNNLNTVADLDDKTKAVRGLPTLVSAANQAFTVGDPNTAASLLTVQDAGGVAVITTGGDIRISIPIGFGMTWNTALTTPTFGGAVAKVNPVVTYADANRTLVVDVTGNFNPLETLTISGVGFSGFVSASAPSNLRLDLNNDGASEATDTATIAIGAPTLASAANQVFAVGDPSTPIAAITITDDPVTARIKAATDLRVRIPAGFTWNPADATAALGGTAAGKVSPAVTFALGNTVAVLNVTADFLPGETLIVSGLEFVGFALTASERLRLETNALGTDADLDAMTYRVGTRPAVMSATTADVNGNGSIDRIVVVFNEDVDGTSPGVINALGFTLPGYTLAFGLETSPGVVTYFIVETGVPDTGATPALSYDPVVGALLDVNDLLEPNAYGPTPVIDGAPPRIVGFSFFDDDANGRLDRLVFTFSENMDETQEDLSDWTILDGDGTTNLLAGLTDASLALALNTLTITLADTTGTTALPRYLYFEDGAGGALRDLAVPVGLLLPSDAKATNNGLPIANAGLDRTYIPTVVTLDGTASSDVDGQPLTYSWTQTSGPAVVLAGGTTATPTFSAFTAATYVFQLTVGDGLSTASDSVSIGILNVPPSAYAGLDQTVTAGATVTLDGSASMDTNGDAITFDWDQISGTVVVVTGANTDSPTFPTAGLNEVLVFRLTVTDSAANTKTDDVIVRVNAIANGVPTADPGGDYVGVVGVPLTLDGGKSSDPEGLLLSYAWSPAVLLTSPATATPTFTPTGPGTYVFTLVVQDASGVDSAPVTTRVTVLPAGSTNRPPSPAATVLPSNAVNIGTTVTLDGSASVDPDGQTVRFAWTLVSGPVVMFPNPSAVAPSFIPVIPGTYVFQLVVGDGSLESGPLFVPVHVLAPLGVAPLAQIAVDLTDDPEQDGRVSSATSPISLQGTSSTGTGLTYAWSQTAGPATALGGATTSVMTFSPPIAGFYRFLLLVIDADGLQDTETIDLVVDTALNQAPTASAGADQTGAAGSVVTLDGNTSSDPAGDGDAVTTFGSGLLGFWRQRSGPATSLSNPSAAGPTFTPSVGGTYVFELVVSDGKAASLADTVSVTVSAPVLGGGGGSSGGGGCGLTGFEVLLLLAFRRRRHMGCEAAR
ncbi:MAG TPA: PKD domain-containing protein [Planctomycetota bacterium]